MTKRPKEKTSGNSFGAMFRAIIALRLPWLWIAFGLVVNLTEADLLLKLPDTTAALLGGDISGETLAKAILYYAVTGIVSIISVAAMTHAETFSVRRTRDVLWKKMLSMRMEWFDKNDPTELMSTFTNDSGASNDLVNLLLNLIPAFYYVVGAMFKIGEYHSVLAISCFVLFPLKYLYALIMGRAFQKSSIRLYDRIGTLTGFLADRLSHLHLIKTCTNEEKEAENGEVAAKELMKANMRIVHQGNVAEVFLSVVDILQKFVVIVAAVVLLRQKKIDLATWLAFFLFTQSLFPYVDQIFDGWTRFKGLQGTFFRIVEIMDSENEQTGDVKEIPADGDIRFCNVTFTYPDTDSPALKDVSFTVPRGTSAAIVGMCGSGKTTAISILERLYYPDEGQVFIGDTDIRDLSLGDYRRHFSYVQQEAAIFSGTLRELLTYGIERDVSDGEIREACEKTGFDEYLMLCDRLLDTEVSAGGNSMSGGQRQRLVLARELLRGGDIILMDEPTSALDADASAKIQDTVSRVFAEKTRISVTHDLRFAESFDKIFVLSNGSLVGEGTYEELMKSCEVFREMNENAETEGEVI